MLKLAMLCRTGIPRILPGIALVGLALALTTPAAASITGVCPDGSIYIVKRASQIPCPNSKRVDPNDVPPVRPENLPRPYGWEKHHQENNPNNPYNLIGEDSAPTPRPERTQTPPVQSAPPPNTALRVPAPTPAPSPITPNLGLAEEELRDLVLIVDLSQRRLPATLSQDTNGSGTLLKLAHSLAFETHLRSVWADRGGLPEAPVLLFSAHAPEARTFHANLAFVQGHVAFHPDRTDPRQFGVLNGSLGTLQPGAEVLGYVVLEPGIDLSKDLDIYWNDRLLSARLR